MHRSEHEAPSPDTAPAGNGQPNLILIGFMACGKSTLGRRCADALGFPFVDSDEAVVALAGKSVTRIFADDGEPAFRTLEAQVIRDLAARRGHVIATGGGVVTNPELVASLRSTGVVVLLQVSVEETARRSARRTNRPLLAGASDPEARIRELLAAREPLYAAAAHAVVHTTGLTRQEATARVLAAYRTYRARAMGTHAAEETA